MGSPAAVIPPGERALNVARRHPAVPTAIAFACGIVADRLGICSWLVWLGAATVCGLGWLIASRRDVWRQSAAWLLLGILCLGAARQHQFWSAAADDDIALYAGEEPRLAVIRGVLVDRPEIVSRSADSPWQSAWAQPDVSQAMIDCRSIERRNATERVTGRIALRVTGHLLQADAGDVVEIRGWLSRPVGPRNPGGSDSADFFRRQGIRALVHSDHPEAVRRIAASALPVWRRWTAGLRTAGAELQNRDLSPRTAPVATRSRGAA